MAAILQLRTCDTAERDALAAELRALLDRHDADLQDAIDAKVVELLDCCIDESTFVQAAPICIDASYFLFEIGSTRTAIAISQRLVLHASTYSAETVSRRVLSILGGQYTDLADYPSAMACYRTSIEIARKLGDQLGEAACISNAASTLQEMGHHRETVQLALRAVSLPCEGDLADQVRLHASSLGLFSAHRLKDLSAAERFQAMGRTYLKSSNRPLNVAFFTRSQCFFLVDCGRQEEAQAVIDHSSLVLAEDRNPRISILMRIAQAITSQGMGDFERASEIIKTLYDETRTSGLYHALVLQASLRVFSSPPTSADALLGLRYANELVEFTTKVKRAKFYRQLAALGTTSASSDASSTSVGAYGDWSGFLATSAGLDSLSGAEALPQVIVKHDELTAIHDDIAALRVARIRREVKTAAVDTAENWAIAAEFFDDETGRHCYRVGHLAGLLAREIGLSESQSIQVELASRLHDIGKIAVNEVILLKPGPLDAGELSAMRLHTEIGGQILEGSEDPTLRMAADIALHHHEWWGGGGYPKRLKGSEIPVPARICAFADVYDALTNKRVYKRAWGHEEALAEIERLAGIQFDPGMLQPFKRVVETYRIDLAANAIPGFADMDENALIASRKQLMEAISRTGH